MRKIFEENKGKLLLSSLIIFLPFLFSVAAGKGIFYQSFFLLLIHWLCLLITLKDRKNSGQSRKALGMVFWLVPMLAMLRGGRYGRLFRYVGGDVFRNRPGICVHGKLFAQSPAEQYAGN